MTAALVALAIAWLLAAIGWTLAALTLATALAVGLAVGRRDSTALRATSSALLKSIMRQRRAERWCAELLEAISIATIEPDITTSPSEETVEAAKQAVLLLGQMTDALIELGDSDARKREGARHDA